MPWVSGSIRSVSDDEGNETTMGLGISRDRVAPRTPLRCPVCTGPLDGVLVRDLGGVTGNLVWEMHAGRCPEHGWFQAEVISRPPREIFPVDRPFGATRRLVIDGQEVYAFPTAWNSVPQAEKLKRTPDPFDADYWRAEPLTGAAMDDRIR